MTQREDVSSEVIDAVDFVRLVEHYGIALKKKVGHEVVGLCPWHEDRDPSFRVEPKGKVWACSPCNKSGGVLAFVMEMDRVSKSEALRKVAEFVGMDLDEEARKVEPQLVATYRYEDASGVLIGVKRRWEPAHDRSGKAKSFQWSQRRDPWAPTLYHLPEVVSAVCEREIVFFVEGEKCADALASLGFVATCNEDGAGKFTAAHAAHLKDARVVILPDNDKTGRDHAASVEKALTGVAQAVCVCDLPGLPPKGDVFDWLKSGHTADDLRAIVVSALWQAELHRARLDLALVGVEKRKWDRPLGKSALKLAESNIEPVPNIVEGLIRERAVVVMGGPPKCGKTWDEAEFAIAIASGTPVYGEFEVRRPGHVLMICLEDDERDLHVRFKALATGRRMSLQSALSRVHYEARGTIDLHSDDDCAGIVASARALPEMPRLICIDPLRDANSGEENSNDDMRRLMHRVRAIRDVTGSAILLIHHLAKPSGDGRGAPAGSIFDRFRGAGALRGAWDGGIGKDMKFRSPNCIKARVEVETRGGRGAGVFGLELDIQDDDRGNAISAGWAFHRDPKLVDPPRGGEEGMEEKILDILRDEADRAKRQKRDPEPVSVRAMAEKLKAAKTPVGALLKEMAAKRHPQIYVTTLGYLLDRREEEEADQF